MHLRSAAKLLSRQQQMSVRETIDVPLSHPLTAIRRYAKRWTESWQNPSRGNADGKPLGECALTRPLIPSAHKLVNKVRPAGEPVLMSATLCQKRTFRCTRFKSVRRVAAISLPAAFFIEHFGKDRPPERTACVVLSRNDQIVGFQA